MSAPSPTVYFITGANRGIGLSLVAELIKGPTNVHVFAGVRKTSPALEELVANHADRLTVVNFSAADESSNQAAARIVDEKFGRVDIVLGIAGIADFLGTAEETPADVMNEHLKINVTGIIVLFRAFAPLLRKSANPKFLPFTSGVGSVTAHISFPAGFSAYGSSKAALNFVARKIHFENEWLTCFPLSPGVVKTDMVTATGKMEKTGILAAYHKTAAIEPEVAAKMLITLVESAQRDTHGGEFINIDGEKVAW